MSAIVPVTGCSSSQPQMIAPATGRTAAESSAAKPTPATSPPWAHWVVINSSCTSTKVVLLAGRIPFARARSKYSSSPKWTITPSATVNHQPPKPTTRRPKAPAA